MKLFLLLSIPIALPVAMESSALSYPAVEMQSCIANAINTAAQKGISTTYKKIQQYCDCSLRKIVDEQKDINSSLSYCNKRYIL